jgi:D-beta-D-heptose 7-phosphate kinase / D-beta-D-heptose 1-phosphate adenosyltransferase
VTAAPLVVVGDTLLDVDLEGEVTRSSPENPSAPVVDLTCGRRRPGGAGLAAVLAAADGAPVRLVTTLADDAEGRWLEATLGRRVELVAGVASGPTCVKIRVLHRGRPLMRLDHGCGTTGSACADMVEGLLGAGAILVADYGRGVTRNPAVVQALRSAVADIPVVWDPHPRGATPVAGCAVVTPNLPEARGALHPTPISPSPMRGGIEAARLLRARWSAQATAVTLGARGTVLALRRDDHRVLRAEPAPRAADTCGAGDCFASTLATALRRGDGPVTATRAAVSRASTFVKAGGAGALRLA